MPALARLVNQDLEISGRSSYNDTTTASRTGGTILDCCAVVLNHALNDKAHWQQSLEWLCLLARSGVDIPVRVFLRLSELALQCNRSAPECFLLADAALSATSLMSIGRQALQKMISDLHSRFALSLVDPNLSPSECSES